MPAVVTKSASKAKCHRYATRNLRKFMKWGKEKAHRLDRRRVRQALREGREPVSEPLFTGRDVI